MTPRSLRRLIAIPVLALGAAPASRAGDLAFEGQVGYFGMAASNSASAVFDSTGGGTYGGAARVTFWRGAFAAVGVRTFSRTGERVFVLSPGSPVQKLGFPLSLRLTPLFVTVGYRLRQGSLIVPYASVGLAITRYKESSEVTGESFDQLLTKTGFVGVAGVEVGRGTFRVGGEVGYTSVPNAIGMGGVSKAYSEDNIGGWHAVGKVIVSFHDSHEPPSKSKKAPAKPQPGPPVAPPKPSASQSSP
jgi:hypothetical protein